MKRGLKVTLTNSKRPSIDGSNLCPDEKGTESSFQIKMISTSSACSNLCPDEKGTESRANRELHRRGEASSNLCPDEKGTESCKLCGLIMSGV